MPTPTNPTGYDRAAAIWCAEFINARSNPQYDRPLDPDDITDVSFGWHEGDSCPTCGYDGYAVIRYTANGREHDFGVESDISFARLVAEIVAIAEREGL